MVPPQRRRKKIGCKICDKIQRLKIKIQKSTQNKTLCQKLEGGEPPLTERQEKHCLYRFWPPFPLYTRAFFPVVRHFFWRIPTEQPLYYKNLGLYYGLASGTQPLKSKPCLGVKGGCASATKMARRKTDPKTHFVERHAFAPHSM